MKDKTLQEYKIELILDLVFTKLEPLKILNY